jgi:hypothetical protein
MRVPATARSDMGAASTVRDVRMSATTVTAAPAAASASAARSVYGIGKHNRPSQHEASGENHRKVLQPHSSTSQNTEKS